MTATSIFDGVVEKRTRLWGKVVVAFLYEVRREGAATESDLNTVELRDRQLRRLVQSTAAAIAVNVQRNQRRQQHWGNESIGEI